MREPVSFGTANGYDRSLNAYAHTATATNTSVTVFYYAMTPCQCRRCRAIRLGVKVQRESRKIMGALVSRAIAKTQSFSK